MGDAVAVYTKCAIVNVIPVLHPVMRRQCLIKMGTVDPACLLHGVVISSGILEIYGSSHSY